MTLKHLRIGQLGKFTGQEFEFDRVTYFYGPNESGKTTIFDAIHAGLCKPPKSRAAGKALQSRYGDDFEIELSFSGATPKVSSEEFLSLLAVRAGALDFAPIETGQWLDSMKNRLFAFGLDQTAIQKRLAGLGSPDKKRKHNRLIEELAARAKDKEAAVAGLRDQLANANHLVAERDLLQKKHAAQELDEKKVQENLASVKRDLDYWSWEKRQLAAGARLNLLVQIRETRSQVEALAPLALLEKQLSLLQQELQGLLSKETEAQTLYTEAKRRLQSTQTKLQASERSLTVDEQSTRSLEELATELSSAVQNPPWVWRHSFDWRIWIAAMLAVAALAACLVIWPQSPLEVWWTLLAALTVAATIASRRRRQEPDETKIQHLIGTASQRLTRIGVTTGIDNLANASSAMNAALQRARELSAQHKYLAAQVQEDQSAAAAAKQQADVAEDSRSQAQRKLSMALAEWNLVSFDDLATKCRRLIELQTKLDELVKQAHLGDISLDEAIQSANLEHERLSAKHMNYTPVSENAAAAEAHQIKLSDQLKRHQLQIEQSAAQLARVTGEIAGRTDGLAARLTDLEAELHQAKASHSAAVQDRDAAKLAAKTFGKIQVDETAALEEIVAESEQLLAESGLAIKRLEGLHSDHIQVTDASGCLRPQMHLSSGSADLVNLIVRLLIAKNIEPECKIVVLDDALQALDIDRKKQALAAIRLFTERYDFQVVLFGKDSAERDLIVQEFKGLTEHSLNRSALPRKEKESDEIAALSVSDTL